MIINNEPACIKINIFFEKQSNCETKENMSLTLKH